MRDCEITSPDATLAQFNRVYNSGKKNHFTLLMNDEMSKFDYLYNSKSSMHGSRGDKKDGSSSDEEEEENAVELHKKLGIQPDDVHDEMKIVLQRQFFEAIVRAASVKYANNTELTTLSEKLETLFKRHLVPYAGKNKAKNAEDEVSIHLHPYRFTEKLQDRPVCL